MCTEFLELCDFLDRNRSRSLFTDVNGNLMSDEKIIKERDRLMSKVSNLERGHEKSNNMKYIDNCNIELEYRKTSNF